MDDHLILEIFDGKRNLPEIVPCLNLTNPLSSLDQLIHRLVCAQLKDYVDIDGILEIFLVFHHKLRFDGFVDLYLCCQLSKIMGTFSFAFDLVKVAFSIILAANFLPVAVCVIS